MDKHKNINTENIMYSNSSSEIFGDDEEMEKLSNRLVELSFTTDFDYGNIINGSEADVLYDKMRKWFDINLSGNNVKPDICEAWFRRFLMWHPFNVRKEDLYVRSISWLYRARDDKLTSKEKIILQSPKYAPLEVGELDD